MSKPALIWGKRILRIRFPWLWLAAAALYLVGLSVLYFEGSDARYRLAAGTILALGVSALAIRARKINEEILTNPGSERANIPQTKWEYSIRNIPSIISSSMTMIAAFIVLSGRRA